MRQYREGNAVTVPTAKGTYRIFSTSTDPAVMMHKAGHAQNMHSLSKLIGQRGMAGAYRVAGNLPTIAVT